MKVNNRWQTKRNKLKSSSWLQFIAVGSLAVGIFLRLLYAKQRVWWDEENTIHFVSEYNAVQLLWEVPYRQPTYGLFYGLVDLWATLTGLPIITGRIISLAAGVSVVVGLYHIGKGIFDRRTGGLMAAIGVAAPVFVIQSGWLRMYALLTLMTLLSWHTLAIHQTSWRWAGLASLTVWLHPFGLFVVGSQFVWIVYTRTVRPWATVAVGMVSVPAVGVLVAKIFSEYLPIYPRHTQSAANLVHIDGAPGALTVILTPAALVVGRLAYPGQIIAGLAVLAVCGLSVGRRWRETPVQLLLCWALVPIVLVAVASYALTPIYQLKYLVIVAPAVIGLVAIGIQEFRRRYQFAIGGAIIAEQLLVLYFGYGDATWHALRVIA